MDWRLRLPGALYRQARDRAGSDAALADRVREWLTGYVTGQPTAGQQLAAQGGHARAASLTTEQRRESARRAARARWDADAKT